MRHPDRDLTLLWATLGRIESRLGLDSQRMADLMRLTHAQYLRMKEERRALGALSVIHLAKHLELDPEQLIEARIDWPALQEHFTGNSSYVPERYRVGAFSRRRTSIHVLEHLRRGVGEDYVYDLIRKFGMTETVFKDPDQTINMRFLQDLADHLRAQGLTRRQLMLMGAETSIVNRNSEFGRIVGAARTTREAYEVQVTQLMHFYDLNCRYRLLRLTDHMALIECRPTIEVKYALGSNRPGSDSFCTVRSGVAAAVPRFIGKALATVEEIRCIHHGAPACQIECRFVERRRRPRPPRPLTADALAV